MLQSLKPLTPGTWAGVQLVTNKYILQQLCNREYSRSFSSELGRLGQVLVSVGYERALALNDCLTQGWAGRAKQVYDPFRHPSHTQSPTGLGGQL
jgi:hypothetical protein